ncbi:hypothetical protein GCM10009547_30500 [Sporichthya brevicatena]|uniref:Uncharacterized protein n=1 Tax=Sporichthya brevicatena TaxID=171442 RepID=A0ABN1H086_9ACTN
MTSYRLLLVRSALGRLARALGYYAVATRAQIRAWRTSYQVQMFGYRIRTALAASGRFVGRIPRQILAGLALVAWFFKELPAYIGRVIADRREDRAELRAERRIAVARVRAERAERRAARAERRARRRAEAAEIKAARGARPNALPVPAWFSRTEGAEGAARPARRIPVPRRAILAAALTMAAAVPAYSVVSGSLSSDEQPRRPEAAAAPAVPSTPAPVAEPVVTAAPSATGAPALPGTGVGPAAPGVGPAAPGPVPTGDTGEFARTLTVLPTPAPAIPAPRLRVASAPDGSVPLDAAAVVGSLTRPLTPAQAAEAQRQAKWERKMTRAPHAAKSAGK